VGIGDGISIGGAVLADQVKSLDWRARAAEYADRAPAAVVEQVLGKLATLLHSV
jgi:mRNA interferase MazF